MPAVQHVPCPFARKPGDEPPLICLYTPDQVALDARNLVHDLFTVAGLKPNPADQIYEATLVTYRDE